MWDIRAFSLDIIVTNLTVTHKLGDVNQDGLLIILRLSLIKEKFPMKFSTGPDSMVKR